MLLKWSFSTVIMLVLMARIVPGASSTLRARAWAAASRRQPRLAVVSMCSSSTTTTTTTPLPSPPKKDWDLKGLKAEVNRAYLRTFKKVGKASERYDKAKKEVDDILQMKDDEVPLARLEQCPNPDELKKDMLVLQDQLGQLAALEEELKSIKTPADERFATVVDAVTALGLSDEPPPKQERGPKKPKGAKGKPRMPYHVYTSAEGLEIRVGRGAADNDLLSCDPTHRDGADWWMHVAGCAGSHVVIRSHDDALPTSAPESLIDAALLAVVNSKAAQSGKVPVSVVRCRQVSKPAGAKDGLVRLSGDILTVKVDPKAEAKRLERLEATKAT